MMPEPVLATLPQAARMLGISRATTYRLVATGEIPSIELAGRRRVVISELLDLIDRKVGKRNITTIESE